VTAHRAAARLMADQCLCFRARRVSRALTRMYDEALRPLGIQATQLTLLNAIALSGEEGGPMSATAELLAMDGTTLSRNLHPLEKAGLVRVGRDLADRRVRIALLTPAGRRLIEQALPRWKRAHRQVVAALGAAQARELRNRFDATVLAAAEPHPAGTRGAA
jgi:DNA-binding MarR family transcriptional regulator